MDKRKELRDIVLGHYADLIGVADHAVSVSEKTETILNGFSRMSSLGRALRVRAATAHLSNQMGSVSPPSIPAESDSGVTKSLVESIVSLNGRVLSSVNVMDFAQVYEIIHSEKPRIISKFKDELVPEEYRGICLREIGSFSKLDARVVSYCYRSLSSASLDSLENMTQCVKLLKTLCENANEYWSRRSMLLSSLRTPWDLVRHFDLSIACSTESSIPLDPEFVNHFGTHTGAISRAILSDFSQLELFAMGRKYFDLKNRLDVFRVKNGSMHIPSSSDVDVSCILENAVRSQIFESVGSWISEMKIDFETFEIKKIEEKISDLIKQVLEFDLVPRSEILRAISIKLGAKLHAASLESDRTVQSGVNVSVFLVQAVSEASSAFSEVISGLSFESLARLREFQKDCFDMHFEETVNRADVRKDAQIASKYGKAESIDIPCHVSAFVFEILLGTIGKIAKLSIESHGIASMSAKSALCRFFSAYFSSLKSPNLQSLFDLSVVLMLTSSVHKDPDHEYLSTSVLRTLEDSVLKEQVDLLLYRDLIKTCAFLAISKNRLIFQILTSSNPMFAHHDSLSLDPNTLIPSSVLEGLARLGESTPDRFPTLPVSRSMTAQQTQSSAKPLGKKQIQPNVFSAASSVTSFLNQVGKITLGSTTPPSR